MHLSWSHSGDIAAALLAAYPDAERPALDHAALLQLIHSLPGFSDAPEPPAATYLDHILWTWMRIAEGDGMRLADQGTPA